MHLLRLLSAAALVVTAAVPASAAAQQRDNAPPPVDRIAFGDRPSTSGGEQITVVGADGSDRVELPTDGERVRWSPDGQRLAFIRDRDLFTIRPDGTDQDRLTVDAGVDAPSWSPNGDVLAALVHSEGVLLIDADGTDARLLPLRPFPQEPVWSPDGGAIAVGVGGQDGRTSLVLLDPTTGAARTVVDGAATGLSVSRPDWTPDGRTLMFTATRDEEPRCCGVYAVEVDGTGLRPLTGPADAAAPSSGSGYIGAPDPPAVSPDGSQVAFAAHDGLFVVPVSGGQRQLVIDVSEEFIPVEQGPAWFADGSGLAFTAHFLGDSGCHCDPSTGYAIRLGEAEPTIFGHGSAVLDAHPSPGAARRLAGLDRVGTALALSRSRTEQSSGGHGPVVLARSDDYADALAAAPFAASWGQTLLLTGRDRLDERVAAEIRRVGGQEVVLLGSEAALSAQVEADVRALGVEVERIAGATRFETAELLAYRTDTFPERTFLVQGADPDPARGWPDAVAVGGVAATHGHAILLTYRDSLPEATLRALRTQLTPRVTIVGGTSAVSTAVEQRLRDEGFTVDRLAGATRYETSRLVAEEALAGQPASEGWDVRLVTGANWPDALAAAPSPGFPALLLLVDGDDLDASAPTRDVLGATTVRAVTLVGGPDVIAPAVEVAVERLLAGR